jgi:RNA polymerase sigma-70 factor (ECF subfamily)
VFFAFFRNGSWIGLSAYLISLDKDIIGTMFGGVSTGSLFQLFDKFKMRLPAPCKEVICKSKYFFYICTWILFECMKQLFNETEILKDLRNEDPLLQRKAFEQIVNFFSEKLYWQIRKMVLSHDDANDLLQNTFIKAWMSIDLFRGESKLSTWLYKIAVNESITFLNKQRQQNSLSLDDNDVFVAAKLESDPYFDGDAAQLKLQKAILTLPEKQRAVFNLRYFEEIPYEEMSGIMGTSVGALKASYHHATKKIEDFLKRN